MPGPAACHGGRLDKGTMLALTRGNDRMHLNIAVGIPTIGRALILRETLIELARQHCRADKQEGS
jgi:hypothetical protein